MARISYADGDNDGKQMNRIERNDSIDRPETDTRPLHVRIRSVLEDRVASGIYPLGSLLPTEFELAREFETSRFTIREALRYLLDRGYVQRRPGVGTRVVDVAPRNNYSLSVGSLEELFQVARGTYFEIRTIEDVTLDAETAEAVGGSEGEDWIRISGLRWTEPGGTPICYVQSYIPARFRPLIPQVRGLQGPMFELLERHADGPILKTVQEISALPMPPDFAALMGEPPDGWALRLLRRYVTDGGVIITSLNWHPSQSMTYVMEIRRGVSSFPATQ
jgi:GntR family transcriptional regulator